MDEIKLTNDNTPLAPTGVTYYSRVSVVREAMSLQYGSVYIKEMVIGDPLAQYEQLKALQSIGVAVPKLIEIIPYNGANLLITSDEGTNLEETIRAATTQAQQSTLLASAGKALHTMHHHITSADIESVASATYKLMTGHPVDHFAHFYFTPHLDTPENEAIHTQEKKARYNSTKEASIGMQLSEEFLQARVGQYIPAELIKTIDNPHLIKLAQMVNLCADTIASMFLPHLYPINDNGLLFLDIENPDIIFGDCKAANILVPEDQANADIIFIDPDISIGNRAFDVSNFIARYLLNNPNSIVNNEQIALQDFLEGYGDAINLHHGPFALPHLVMLGMLNILRRHIMVYTINGLRGYDLFATFDDPLQTEYLIKRLEQIQACIDGNCSINDLIAGISI